MTTNNAANIAALVGTQIINQVGHGFAIGDVLYLNGSTYTKAIATSAAASQVVGVVIKSIDVDNFILQSNGVVAGLSGLTAGNLYYLSGSSAGALTATISATSPTRVKPILIAQSTTTGLLINNPSYSPFLNTLMSNNILDNSSFMVNSWGITFTNATTPVNSNDNYLVDRWVYLANAANTANVAVSSAVSEVAFAQANTITFTQQTANKQYGFVQLIESPTLATYRRTSLSCTIVVAAPLANVTARIVRFAILEWNGTLNTMTSDVVSAWAGGGVNPTLAANWSYVVTSSQITCPVAGSYYTITGTTGTGINNIAVFVWLDDTNATANDIIYLGASWLLPGNGIVTPADGTPVGTASTAGTVFPLKSKAIELINCQRFFQSSYGGTVAPGTVATAGQSAAQASSATTSIASMQNRVVSLRTTPTVTWYSPGTGAAANLRDVTSAADAAVTSTTGVAGTSTGYPVLTGATTADHILTGHYTLDANL